MTAPAREIVDLLKDFLRRRWDVTGEPSAAPFVVDANHHDAAFPQNSVAAADLDPRDVRTRLTHFAGYVAAQVNAGEVARIELPDLHRANAIFDARGNVFLGHSTRNLMLDREGGEAFMRLLLTLEVASDNVRDGVCTTKRGLFYQHRAKLPDSTQLHTDRAIASLANVLRVRRRALGFVEARRGTIYGRLVIREGTEVVDLAQVGPAGRTIPRFTDDVDILSSDAALIVIIEKDAVAHRLAESRWWDTARCIMVSGQGFPAMSTREFLRKLIDTLGIPVVIFTDADPAGVQLALTYAHGSISTALETPWLACSEIRWAGFFPSDFGRHCGPEAKIFLTENDADRARELLQHPSRTYVNDAVRKELAILLDRGFKTELDSLCHGSRLTDYLRQKLFESSLIEL